MNFQFLHINIYVNISDFYIILSEICPFLTMNIDEKQLISLYLYESHLINNVIYLNVYLNICELYHKRYIFK